VTRTSRFGDVASTSGHWFRATLLYAAGLVADRDYKMRFWARMTPWHLPSRGHRCRRRRQSTDPGTADSGEEDRSGRKSGSSPSLHRSRNMPGPYVPDSIRRCAMQSVAPSGDR